MSDMNQYLASYFGNTVSSAPSSEDLEKSAQADLFMKLAAANNVDLEQLNDEQLSQLWSATFSKEAEMAPPFGKKDEKDDDEDKKDKAKEELAEKKAEAEKFAEAEKMGQIMAHSYVAELRKIAEAVQEEEKKAAAASAPAALPEIAKLGSAVDQLAAKSALEKAASAGWDATEAAGRINAVLTLGLGESEKIAAQAATLDVETATEIRALEFLQAAGYPVTWNS